MGIIVGSARQDENGKLVNGKAGDQNGKEVSTQPFYVHKKGWYILRPKQTMHADMIAKKMISACNNNNIGYDQNQRLGIITHGVDTLTPTECDCSSLVRQCIKESTGTDVGNFTTINEASVLEKSGLFEARIAYTSKTPVYNGDVLVTQSKGHTVIVVSGNPRPQSHAPSPNSKIDFIRECAIIFSCNETGTEIFGRTITISKKINKRHPVVKPIQRRLIALGYSCGSCGADGDFGTATENAVKAFQKTWTNKPDGVIDGRNTTWKKLLVI